MTSYNFTNPPRPVDPVDLVPTPHKLLIEAGRKLDVLSLKTGALHPILQTMAQEHAETQASEDKLGHQGWPSRSKWLFSAIPDAIGFREVAAQTAYAEDQAAAHLFEAWWKSPDHWPWVNGQCDFWGYGMARGKSGMWYGCGIFADRRA